MTNTHHFKLGIPKQTPEIQSATNENEPQYRQQEKHQYIKTYGLNYTQAMCIRQI